MRILNAYLKTVLIKKILNTSQLTSESRMQSLNMYNVHTFYLLSWSRMQFRVISLHCSCKYN